MTQAYGQDKYDNIEFWMTREDAVEVESESRDERRTRLQKYVLNAETGMMSNPAYRAKIDAARAALEAMNAEDEAAFRAEWTAEVTAARRAAWNAWVKTQRNPQWPAIRQQERAQGWTLESLKKAVQIHN